MGGEIDTIGIYSQYGIGNDNIRYGIIYDMVCGIASSGVWYCLVLYVMVYDIVCYGLVNGI